MSEWYDLAEKRLKAEAGKVDGPKENHMKSAVMTALLDFCRQDAEFAQAVAQGGSFQDCMKAVAKGVGIHIPDIDAYRRAVSFYFPGAGITVRMTIDLCASVQGAPHPDGPGIVLDLKDFL